MNLVTEHVRIENPDSAVDYLKLKKRRSWISSTTTPPPPMPPMVASAIIMIRTKVPIPSMIVNGSKRGLCSHTPSITTSLWNVLNVEVVRYFYYF